MIFDVTEVKMSSLIVDIMHFFDFMKYQHWWSIRVQWSFFENCILDRARHGQFLAGKASTVAATSLSTLQNQICYDFCCTQVLVYSIIIMNRNYLEQEWQLDTLLPHLVAG